jgi:hypothetical protein
MIHLTKCRLALMTGFLWAFSMASATSGEQRGKSLSQRIAGTEWAKIRGVNYIPSYGRNMHEMWRDYNHEAFDAELAMARNVGYDSVRLWLNYFAFAERGPKMVDAVEDAVKLCRQHGLKVLVTLFDGCGIRPRADARRMTVKEGYDHFLASPRLSQQQKQIVKFNYERFAQGVGRNILIWVGEDTPPDIIVWQHWQPNPGYDKLGEEWWPKLDVYIREVVGRLAGNDTILGWDLMNEPELASEHPFTNGFNVPEVRNRVMGFTRHVRDVIKKDYPDEIVTVGFAALKSCMEYESLSDVLTFHVYAPERLQAEIEQAHSFGAKLGKPIFITETLANFSFMPYDVEKLATDEGQLEHYQKVLPILIKSPIGWMAWGLVVGRIFDSYTDIFYANGHPRPAAIYLEGMLKGPTGSKTDVVKPQR